MFRPISMVVPDSGYIAEIILFGEGFNNTRVSIQTVMVICFMICLLMNLSYIFKLTHFADKVVLAVL